MNDLQRVTICLLTTLCLWPQTSAVASERPNVLLIMVDDLGFSDLGCYGSEIETPHIDALAAAGTRFNQFYNTAKCHSSRICLLTGKYPFQAGNEAMDKALTSAEVMQQAGYFTAMTGKWHLDGEPTERGFMRYWGHLSGATNFFTGDRTFRLNGALWQDFDGDFYTTDANVDFAIQFIDEAVSLGQPFFQYIAFNAPHYPLQAKQHDVLKYKGRYAEGWDVIRQRRYQKQLASGLFDQKYELSPRPDYIPAWSDLTPAEKAWEEARMEVFAAMVDCVDQNVGRLVAHLSEHGVLENTLILFCSDNGACPFDRTRGKDLQPWNPKSYWCYDVGWAHVGNTPFRWYKQNQHEGGISSPLIAHWPAGITSPPGALCAEPGHLIDLLPTIAEATASEYPDEYAGRRTTPVQGRSLLPLLQGQTQPDAHEWIYFQFANNRALRSGPWKVVSARGGPWELYDLTTDRTELHDLSGAHPEKTKALAEMWYSAAEEIDHAPKRLRKPITEQQLQTFPPGQMTERKAGPRRPAGKAK